MTNETSASVVDSTPSLNTPDCSPQDLESERASIKKLLAEARQTYEMLTAFIVAVEKGTFIGYAMIDIAKGVSFLQAILNQNKNHISNLQERLGNK
jgi:hypothetical protein